MRRRFVGFDAYKQAMDCLKLEFARMGRTRLFDELKEFVWGERSGLSQVEVAARLEMSEGAVNVAVHRLRHRYRELLREEIAHTLSRPEDVDAELRHLKAVLSS